MLKSGKGAGEERERSERGAREEREKREREREKERRREEMMRAGLDRTDPSTLFDHSKTYFFIVYISLLRLLSCTPFSHAVSVYSRGVYSSTHTHSLGALLAAVGCERRTL